MFRYLLIIGLVFSKDNSKSNHYNESSDIDTLNPKHTSKDRNNKITSFLSEMSSSGEIDSDNIPDTMEKYFRDSRSQSNHRKNGNIEKSHGFNYTRINKRISKLEKKINQMSKNINQRSSPRREDYENPRISNSKRRYRKRKNNMNDDYSNSENIAVQKGKKANKYE